MKEEKLLGDLVEEQLKKLKMDKVASVISTITKKPCGCQKRKEQLNTLHKRIKNK